MKKQISYLNTPLLLLSLFIASTHCQAEIIPMTEEQLETEAGKGFSISTSPTGTLHFAMDEQTKSGTPISASGTLDVLQNAQDINQANLLSLSDAAQQNLQALVSVNAVDSLVQVLVNMNVNINSTVDIIEQTNQALQNQAFVTPTTP